MSDENPYAAPSADITLPDSSEVAPPSRGKRLGGAIIDGIIVAIIYVPLIMLSGNWERMLAGQESQTQAFLIWMVGVTVFLTVNGVLLAQRGQTIGKLILRMRIVSFETNEQLPFWKVYGLRYLPLQLLGLFGVIGSLVNLINVLFIFGREKRCLHDYVANTKVVNIA